LDDMKTQYDQANQQHQQYTNDANNFQSALSNLQATANAKYEEIHKLCKELSKICSRFNFVDELHANIESMRQDARLIQNVNIRKNAESEIARLEKLANDLSSNRVRHDTSISDFAIYNSNTHDDYDDIMSTNQSPNIQYIGKSKFGKKLKNIFKKK
ncbi:11077_t:CDS:1, partial [Racocetra fulgida]